MKYSVVIPIYNAKEYIDKCVLSIVTKPFDGELVLVDDGSVDGSGEICDFYQEKYPCVKVIHIENSGAGNARNEGVKNASGEFLIFSDADDYLSDDFFEKLENSDVDFSADVIFFNAVKIFPDGRMEDMNCGFEREKLLNKTKEEVYEHLSTCNKFPSSCWAKIINRDFYVKNNISLHGGWMGEDIDWTMELILRGAKYDLFSEGIYYYRKVPGTRSSHGSIKNTADQLSIVEKWAEHSETEKYKKYFDRFIAYQYAMVFPFLGSLKRKERKKFIGRMKKLRGFLKYGTTKKLKMINLAVTILGIDLTAVILYNFIAVRDRGVHK